MCETLQGKAMGVKTVQCEACRRDMPRNMTIVVVIEGYEMVVCIDPVDCRKHHEKGGDFS